MTDNVIDLMSPTWVRPHPQSPAAQAGYSHGRIVRSHVGKQGLRFLVEWRRPKSSTNGDGEDFFGSSAGGDIDDPSLRVTKIKEWAEPRHVVAWNNLSSPPAPGTEGTVLPFAKAEGEKPTRWAGRFIIDSSHRHQLERDAALLWLQGQDPKEAEGAVYDKYKKVRHAEAAAHHLMGQRAASAASDTDQARRHGALYVLHVKALGGNPYGVVPPEVQARIGSFNSMGLYRFKPHAADAYLLKDDTIAKMEKTIEEELTKGEVIPFKSQSPENRASVLSGSPPASVIRLPGRAAPLMYRTDYNQALHPDWVQAGYSAELGLDTDGQFTARLLRHGREVASHRFDPRRSQWSASPIPEQHKGPATALQDAMRGLVLGKSELAKGDVIQFPTERIEPRADGEPDVDTKIIPIKSGKQGSPVRRFLKPPIGTCFPDGKMIFDYDHLLNPEHLAAKYHLSVEYAPGKDNDLILGQLSFNGTPVAQQRTFPVVPQSGIPGYTGRELTSLPEAWESGQPLDSQHNAALPALANAINALRTRILSGDIFEYS